MKDCCDKEEIAPKLSSCCDDESDSSVSERKHDFLLIYSSGIILLAYSYSFFIPFNFLWLNSFSVSIQEIVNTMIWGILIGILFIGLLSNVPREYIIALLGRKGGLSGILRATFAGVFLDLCSHGILMVGAKLYERGATTGQVMAFLIASPWNSISLTIILWTMIGFNWMITFLLLSMLIAIIAGMIFESLVASGKLPDNKNRIELPDDYQVFAVTKNAIVQTQYNFAFFKSIIVNGIIDSRIVMRWIFFGIVLAALVRTFMSENLFQTWFGPTLLGLSITLVMATIIEVCSEGTVPVAADILTRGGAPGNSFAFLMAGVSTDYTEIMVMKEATASWKVSLFLPLITLPQIIILAVIMNILS